MCIGNVGEKSDAVDADISGSGQAEKGWVQEIGLLSYLI